MPRSINYGSAWLSPEMLEASTYAEKRSHDRAWRLINKRCTV